MTTARALLLAAFLLGKPGGAAREQSRKPAAVCDRVEQSMKRCRAAGACEPTLALLERLAVGGDRSRLGACMDSFHSRGFFELLGWMYQNPKLTRETRLRALKLAARDAVPLDGEVGEDFGTFVSMARDISRFDALTPLEAIRAIHAKALRGTARASSTLARQGASAYGAENVLDGDTATAWCEGDPGPGLGAWIELRVPRATDGMTLVVLPGYAKSQQTWEANDRVLAFHLASCASLGAGYEIELSREIEEIAEYGGFFLQDDVRYAPVRITVWAKDLQGPLDCIRFTIRKTVPGKHDDTCISEIVPIVER